MLQNAYSLAKIGADTAENERNFAKNGQLPTDGLRLDGLRLRLMSGPQQSRRSPTTYGGRTTDTLVPGFVSFGHLRLDGEGVSVFRQQTYLPFFPSSKHFWKTVRLPFERHALRAALRGPALAEGAIPRL